MNTPGTVNNDDQFESQLERLSIISFMIIALLLGTDIGERVSHGSDKVQVSFEFTAFALAFLMLGAKFLRITQIFLDYRRDDAEESALLEEWQRWKERSSAPLTALEAAMKDQFKVWELEPEEEELAILLLSGGSLERDRSPLAEALFEKAGVRGKSELLAFFFGSLREDGGIPERLRS